MAEGKILQPVERVSIIVSRGSLEGVYPGLIMANGARMEGIEASLFFTFFGLDAITNKRLDHLKVATVGNPGHVGICHAHDEERNRKAEYSTDPRVSANHP